MPRINKITVRRGEGPPSHNDLDTAELAFDMKAKKLYVGASDGEAVKVGGDSIWMGPQPPEDKDIKYWIDTSSDGSIDTEKALIVDTIYPVGSIYMSVSATNPQLLFGGTWEQIKDTFLLASGDSYTAGSTGGSPDAIVVSHTHTFTGSQVDSGGQSQTHTHTFTGSEVTSGGQSQSHTHTVTGGSHSHRARYASGKAGTGSTQHLPDSSTSTWKAKETWIEADGGHSHTVGNASQGHTHKVTAAGTNGNASQGHTHKVTAAGTNALTGVSGVDANMPPYLTVYMWKRVS